MGYAVNGNLAVDSEVGVLLPTYREEENIENLIHEIENLKFKTSILVIDDSSPDKTAEKVLNLQKEYGNILLYNRPKKLGLGSAITDGFKIFLNLPHVPKYVITMDADYSHNPQVIPQLVSTMKNGCGITIGSRYIKGGEIRGWPLTRKVISRTANAIAQFCFNLDLHDCTSGFRCYSTDFLKVVISSLHSQTYEIQIETIRQASIRDFKVNESPICFVNRKRGKSKLTSVEFKSYLSYILKVLLNN